MEMTIETLTLLQNAKRKSIMPTGEIGLFQAILERLTETVILLTEICIELKQARMHE